MDSYKSFELYEFVPYCGQCDLIVRTILKEIGEQQMKLGIYYTWTTKLIDQLKGKMSRRTVYKHVRELVSLWKILSEVTPKHIHSLFFDLESYFDALKHNYEVFYERNDRELSAKEAKYLRNKTWYMTIEPLQQEYERRISEFIVQLKVETYASTNRKLLVFSNELDFDFMSKLVEKSFQFFFEKYELSKTSTA